MSDASEGLCIDLRMQNGPRSQKNHDGKLNEEALAFDVLTLDGSSPNLAVFRKKRPTVTRTCCLRGS